MHIGNPKAVVAWVAIMSLGLKPGASPETVAVAFGGCVLLGVLIFSGYALLFSTAPMVRGYARSRRWIEAGLAVFFAGAGVRLLLSRQPCLRIKPMPDKAPFHGLSAFPLTPADEQGRVDAETLARLLERLCAAGVDSIGLLGSTGVYAYLTREERRRAVAAAAECVGGRAPLIVGIGALRTDQAQALARDAEAAGADALLMAPVSYTPLTQDEAFEHFRSVASVSGLPLCIYNNPGTTHFSFGAELLARLSGIETIRAVKMPLPADGDFAGELAALRASTKLAIGYSGDWGMADAMLAGADAFYSVLGGMLPQLAVSLVRAAQAGDADEARRIDDALAPLWDTFKTYGSLRVMYVLLDMLELGNQQPPRPILPLGLDAYRRVASAVEPLLDR